MLIEDIQGYVDAYHLGYITSIEANTIVCPHDSHHSCDDCPGASLCETLSNNGHYDEFVANYVKANIAERLREEVEL